MTTYDTEREARRREAEWATASSGDPQRDAQTTDQDETERLYRAGFATGHPAHGAVVAQKFLGPVFGPEAAWWDHLDALQAQIKQTQQGDLSGVEAMLVTQAHALDAIFTGLATQASEYAEKYPRATDTYLRLALKAQAQCRATLEALAEIKNPRPVAFVQQANIATGPQQVNSQFGGSTAPSAPPARAENLKASNELLMDDHGTTLDRAGTQTTVHVDPALESVGKLDRPDI